MQQKRETDLLRRRKSDAGNGQRDSGPLSIPPFESGIAKWDIDKGPEGGDVLFFLHGWPDSARMWDELTDDLAKAGYRCVAVTLPYYDRDLCERKFPMLGLSMDEMADFVKERVESLAQNAVLITHDFGSVYAFYALQKYPSLASAIVTLDIGNIHGLCIGERATDSFLRGSANLMMYGFLYQYLLCGAFLASKIPGVGIVLEAMFSRVMKYTGKSWRGNIGIRSTFGYVHLQTNFFMQSLYCVFGKSRLLTLFPKSVSSEEVTSEKTGFANFPKIPVLFIYGKSKPIMFHEKEWESGVQNRQDGSRVVALPTGHWPHLTKKDDCLRHIKIFLNDLRMR